MRQVPLIFPFFLALFFALCGSVFFPHIRLIAFSPFLALLFTRMNVVFALWCAALCGLLIDLLSSEFRFGLHALGYALTTLLLFKQKRHFFEDKVMTLSIFTALISMVSTVVQLLLIAIFDKPIPLSPKLMIADLFVMPLADGVYAFIWFSCPMLLYAYIQEIGLREFCNRLLKWAHLGPNTEEP